MTVTSPLALPTTGEPDGPEYLCRVLLDGQGRALGLDLVHLGFERALHFHHHFGIAEQIVLDDGFDLLALRRAEAAFARCGLLRCGLGRRSGCGGRLGLGRLCAAGGGSWFCPMASTAPTSRMAGASSAPPFFELRASTMAASVIQNSCTFDCEGQPDRLHYVGGALYFVMSSARIHSGEPRGSLARARPANICACLILPSAKCPCAAARSACGILALAIKGRGQLVMGRRMGGVGQDARAQQRHGLIQQSGIFGGQHRLGQARTGSGIRCRRPVAGPCASWGSHPGACRSNSRSCP